MRAFCLRIGLRHVRTCFGFAVVVRPIAVVDVARRIHPHHAGPASSCLGTRSSLGCRRRFSRRSSSHRSRSRRHRRWSRSRLRSRRWSCRHRSRRSCLHRRRGSVSGIPLLHPLVSTARTCLLRGRRISPVFTLPGGTGWRGLRYCCLCNQKTCRKRNETNRFIHKFSKDQICGKLLLRIPPNPTPSRQPCHQKVGSRCRKRPSCNPNE
jgi:hypothetical protein